MTDITRRAVIGAGAAGVVAGVLGPTPAEAAAPRRHPRKTKRVRRPVNLYSRSRFTPLRGATFTLGDVTATLTDVADLPGARVGSDGCFSLTFRTTTEGPLQGTYTLRRSRFTPTTLFVVPSDVDRRTYQAVIYRAG